MDTIAENITGRTALCGLLGWPASHSFSPVLQNTLADWMGEDLRYLAFSVAPADLKAAVAGGLALGVRGFNVTVPHKQAVMECLRQVDPLASRVGAVNTLVQRDGGYDGYNTDVTGLERALADLPVRGEPVAVLGAGGAAYAAAAYAERAGAGRLYLVNRTRAKAEALAGRLELPVTVLGYEELEKIPGLALLIQTTSVGMGDPAATPLPDPAVLKRTRVVMDCVYTPWRTRLLQDAAAAGCRWQNGFDMLVYQGVASFELWTGRKVPAETARRLREKLAAVFRGEKA